MKLDAIVAAYNFLVNLSNMRYAVNEINQRLKRASLFISVGWFAHASHRQCISTRSECSSNEFISTN